MLGISTGQAVEIAVNPRCGQWLTNKPVQSIMIEGDGLWARSRCPGGKELAK